MRSAAFWDSPNDKGRQQMEPKSGNRQRRGRGHQEVAEDHVSEEASGSTGTARWYDQHDDRIADAGEARRYQGGRGRANGSNSSRSEFSNRDPSHSSSGGRYAGGGEDMYSASGRKNVGKGEGQGPKMWEYRDPQGRVQGPFKSSQMAEWINADFFAKDLPVRQKGYDTFTPLHKVLKVLLKDAEGKGDASSVNSTPRAGGQRRREDRAFDRGAENQGVNSGYERKEGGDNPRRKREGRGRGAAAAAAAAAAEAKLEPQEEVKLLPDGSLDWDATAPEAPPQEEEEEQRPRNILKQPNFNANQPPQQQPSREQERPRRGRESAAAGQGDSSRPAKGQGGRNKKEKPANPAKPELYSRKISQQLFTAGAKQGAEEPVWRYIDPAGNVQGPFPANHMTTWYCDGLLMASLPVCGTERKVAPPDLPPKTLYRPLDDLLRQVDERQGFKPVSLEDVRRAASPQAKPRANKPTGAGEDAAAATPSSAEQAQGSAAKGVADGSSVEAAKAPAAGHAAAAVGEAATVAGDKIHESADDSAVEAAKATTVEVKLLEGGSSDSLAALPGKVASSLVLDGPGTPRSVGSASLAVQPGSPRSVASVSLEPLSLHKSALSASSIGAVPESAAAAGGTGDDSSLPPASAADIGGALRDALDATVPSEAAAPLSPADDTANAVISDGETATPEQLLPAATAPVPAAESAPKADDVSAESVVKLPAAAFSSGLAEAEVADADKPAADKTANRIDSSATSALPADDKAAESAAGEKASALHAEPAAASTQLPAAAARDSAAAATQMQLTQKGLLNQKQAPGLQM
ncbi:hypothetical protein WJX73_006254 [Symbiochloris irregularis]|uniref:GYF domain-containing protein n=1 Tax=Symbiochloris irregularis TaxID=706552 RepID=A0AAW1PLC4_9CHLO